MWFDIISLIISILSLGATIAISIIIYKLERKNEKRNKEKEIRENAKKFISENIDEKEYLPLATIASGCFSQNKHYRKIYNEFSLLDDDTKKEVLKLADMDCQLINNDEWIKEKIDLIKEAIKELGIGRDFLYDGGKYLTRAYNYKENSILEFENLKTNQYLYNDVFGIRKNIIIFKRSDKLTYEEYLNDYLYIKYCENKKMSEDVRLPNEYLFEMEDLGDCDEDKICFWMMVMVRNVIIYSMRYLGYKQKEHTCFSSSNIKTFEDKYFSVLYELYYLEKEYAKKKKRQKI